MTPELPDLPSPALGSVNPQGGDDESRSVVVNQALFGYADGHRLLGSDAPLSPELVSTLSRLTDGTGAESYKGFDGYLSGYPLPDGRYAISRTWKAESSKRPGAVLTHVLLIDGTDLGAIGSPAALLGLLERPVGTNQPDDLARYKTPMTIRNSAKLVPGRTSGDWRSTLSALYGSEDVSVWLTADEASNVEMDVLRLWWWQWPALRRRFSFCLGASGRRTIAGRDFDLLVVPTTRRLSAAADFGAPPKEITAAGTLIDADLRGEMPEIFRSYLRFCGAETQRRSAAGLLSEIWMAAEDPEADPAVVQVRIAERVRKVFPSPSTMRRLKRTIVTPDVRLPARWGRVESAALFIKTHFGECVLAADVDLEELLSAVREQPQLLLEAARPPSHLGTKGDDSYRSEDVQLAAPADAVRPAQNRQPDRTVAQVLPHHARAALGRFAQPTWLEEIAGLGPQTVFEVLLTVKAADHEPWARAYWALEPTVRTDASSAYTAWLRSDRDSQTSLGWLAAYAAEPAEGSAWLARTHTSRRARQKGLSDFVGELVGFEDSRRQGWRAMVRDAAMLRELMEIAQYSSLPEVKALLVVADPSRPEMVDGGLAPWIGLSLTELTPIEGAHILRITPSTLSRPEEVALAARAFASVWEACAQDDWSVWNALGNYPDQLGFGQDWDRARRVSRRFARTIPRTGREATPNSADVVNQLLQITSDVSSRAADQLAREIADLTQPHPKTFVDGGSKAKKKSNQRKYGKGPLEQARRIAADWLGLN